MNGYEILVAAHVIGVAFSVGAVTVGDMLFFRAVKQKKIDESMVETWKIVSRIVWTGLVILFLSGVLFFVAYRLGMPSRLPLAFTAKFWLKMTIVGVLFINGLFMHWKAIPILSKIVQEGGQLRSPIFQSAAPVFFANGAISLISWYAVILLGVMRNLSLTFWQGLILYIALLGIAIGISQILRRRVQYYLTKT